jgi:hypothetical protein
MEKQAVLFLSRHFLDPLDDAGEKGAAEDGRMVGRDQAANARVFLAQSPRVGLGFVMKILDGDLDFLSAVITNPFFVVQNAGNGPNGDSRMLGDILDGGHGIAPSQVVPAQNKRALRPLPQV